jgi:hypothetical protein
MEPATGNNAANSGAGPQPSVHYHYYGPQYAGGWYYSPNQYCPRPHKSRKPSIAGFFLIFAAILTIIMGSMMGSFAFSVGPMGDMMDNSANQTDDVLLNLQGQIIFMNSTPAVGVNVTIVDLNIMAQTNSTGNYKILNVAQGWHDLKVELPGYKVLLQSVKVAKSMVGMHAGYDMEWKDYVTTDFQLQPGSGDLRIGTAHDTGAIKNDWETGKPFFQNFATICLVAGVIGAVFMFIGGYFAIKRTKLPWVIVGCVFAMIFGSVLGIIAIILVLMSTNEFDRKDKGHDENGPRTGGGPGTPPDAPKAAEPKAPLSTPPTGPEKIGTPYGGYQYPVYSYPPNPIPQPTVRQY